MSGEATYREYKAFTKERLQELIFECEQNVDECVRLVDMLLLDAQDMADSKAIANATAAFERAEKAAVKARDALYGMMVLK